MGAYELILSIDNTVIERLKESGLFRTTVQRDFDVYSYYLEQKKIYGTMQSVTNTAEKFCYSEEQIFKIIRRMR